MNLSSEMKRAKSPRWVAAGLALLALGASIPAQADIVTDWAAVAANTILPAGVPGAPTAAERVPIYSVDMATVHLAIYDTVVAFEGGYDPFAAVPASQPPGALEAAAINEAAYQVLKTLFPSRSAIYQGFYDAHMAPLAGQPGFTSGKAAGADVAAQILLWRSNDGREIPVDLSWLGQTTPGIFQTTNPATLAGVTMPSVRPFAISSADQFRPQGPPALTSEEYAEAYNEVKQRGIDDARSSRSVDEDNLAHFGTSPPPPFWTRNLTRFGSLPTVVENARLLAAVWVAHSDAMIGCFDAKYHFRFWRPRTAIPGGATDGNSETVGDASWLPNEPTPNHPEYPAAHSCATGSSFEAIQQIYGTKKINFFMDFAPGTLVRNYTSTDDFIKDIKDARVLGGMHFRTSTDDGSTLGRQTAKWVLKYYFRPVDRNGPHGNGQGGQ